MKYRTAFSMIILVCACLSTSYAQVQLPQKSPAASVSYTVGLTTVTINYSSPAVNDRRLWGSLVPYGKVWRAGANAATTITFSTGVNVEGEDLDAGTYSFFLIPRPGEEKWTAIFNQRADQWGATEYNQAQDAARVDIKPQFLTANQERLTYSIHDQDLDKGYIKLAWGTARIYLRFRVYVEEQAMTNIKEALETAKEDEKWVIYAQGANFLLEHDLDPRQAMEWADKSTKLYDHSWNWYVKAQLQAKAGDYSGALASAARSSEAGAANPRDNYFRENRSEISSKVTEWKRKLGS
ncbi:MAG: DUF2911 domain-containing protein [Saprospiraceae bacterium]|nr:DUF2911 domain-containing protein [Saprospiraceae bacterium]